LSARTCPIAVPARRRYLLLLAMAGPALAQPLRRLITSSTLLDADLASRTAERIMREAYRRIGFELQVLRLPGERSLVSANSGATDSELFRMVGIEASYTNLLMVPYRLFDYEIVAVSKMPLLSTGQWSELRKHRVGYVRGIKIIEKNLAGGQGQAVPTLAKALEMLERDRVDLVLVSRMAGTVVPEGWRNMGAHASSPPLASFAVYHHVNRRHRGLVAELAAALRSMDLDGTLAHLRADADSAG